MSKTDIRFACIIFTHIIFTYIIFTHIIFCVHSIFPSMSILLFLRPEFSLFSLFFSLFVIFFLFFFNHLQVITRLAYFFWYLYRVLHGCVSTMKPWCDWVVENENPRSQAKSRIPGFVWPPDVDPTNFFVLHSLFFILCSSFLRFGTVVIYLTAMINDEC